MSRFSRRVPPVWLVASILVLAFGATSCKRNRLSSKPEPPPKTLVHVTNGDFLDATIYVVRRGQSVRLGTAGSNSSTTFVIPSQLVFGSTVLSFIIDPVGSNRRQSTDEVLVDAGDELELRLGAGRPQLVKKSS